MLVFYEVSIIVGRTAPEVARVPVSTRSRFAAELGFELDDFQRRALDALDAGGSVVVAAPTGSGKTVVAQYAVARALDAGGKAFYTTPLKALSNQKYRELVRRHGAEAVGLLTGDNAINGNAPVVVMTTEVLRNMIYASSAALDGLALRGPRRGPLPPERLPRPGLGGGDHPRPAGVDLVCLSATVSNAEELADWIRTVRGATTAVIEDRRPVELHDLYLLGDKGSERLLLLPTLVDGRPNPEAAALDSKTLRHPGMRGRPAGAAFHPPAGRGGRAARRARHAPGDLLHLQPGRVRRRRRPMRRGRASGSPPPTSAGRSGPSPRHTWRRSPTTTWPSSTTPAG